jgi:hypothetical protein
METIIKQLLIGDEKSKTIIKQLLKEYFKYTTTEEKDSEKMTSFVLQSKPVFRIRIRIRIHMLLGLPDPDLVRGMDPDPDPSIIKQKL